MPKKRKSNLSQKSAKARAISSHRSSETPEERQVRLEIDAAAHAHQRSSQTPEERQIRLDVNAAIHATFRATQTADEHEIIITQRRLERENFLRKSWEPFKGIGFRYNPTIEYNDHGFLTIDRMNKTCRFCGALKWKGKSLGMCCSNGKVKLPLLEEPPQLLKTLLLG